MVSLGGRAVPDSNGTYPPKGLHDPSALMTQVPS